MAAARIYMSRVNGGAATPDSTFFSQTFGVCPSLNQKWWVWMFLIVICGDITSTVSILHCTYLVGIPQKFSNIQSRPHCHGESTKGNGSKHLKITKQIPYFCAWLMDPVTIATSVVTMRFDRIAAGFAYDASSVVCLQEGWAAPVFGWSEGPENSDLAKSGSQVDIAGSYWNPFFNMALANQPPPMPVQIWSHRSVGFKLLLAITNEAIKMGGFTWYDLRWTEVLSVHVGFPLLPLAILETSRNGSSTMFPFFPGKRMLYYNILYYIII